MSGSQQQWGSICNFGTCKFNLEAGLIRERNYCKPSSTVWTSHVGTLKDRKLRRGVEWSTSHSLHCSPAKKTSPNSLALCHPLAGKAQKQWLQLTVPSVDKVQANTLKWSMKFWRDQMMGWIIMVVREIETIAMNVRTMCIRTLCTSHVTDSQKCSPDTKEVHQPVCNSLQGDLSLKCCSFSGGSQLVFMV